MLHTLQKNLHKNLINLISKRNYMHDNEDYRYSTTTNVHEKRSCLKKNCFINIGNVLTDLIYHFYRVQSSLDQTFSNNILST